MGDWACGRWRSDSYVECSVRKQAATLSGSWTAALLLQQYQVVEQQHTAAAAGVPASLTADSFESHT